MKLRGKTQGVEAEPHLKPGAFEADPSERRAADNLSHAEDGWDDRAEYSVWDEPAHAADAAAGEIPPAALTFGRWLAWRRRTTPAWRSWLVTLGIVLCAGPWAILGAFMGARYGSAGFGLLSLCLFGPAIEEALKASVCLVVVEKRPYLFRSRFQILLCCVASGLVFAAVENVLYLHVYTRRPSALLTHWRWTICVFLHASCAFCTGMGLARSWARSLRESRRPDLSVVMPYLVAAVAIHGAYNFTAVVTAALGFHL